MAILTSLAFPFIRRLADVIGVRWTATIGMTTLPLCYLALSMMNGSIGIYSAIIFFQSALCVTTTATVYTRLVVQYVERARGLGLAIAVSGPAISGAIGGPILNAYVEANGWRESYQALAVFSAVAAIVTFALIPPAGKGPKIATAPLRRARDDYPAIFRTATFWILLGAMLLCNLPGTIMLVQLKLLLLANGVSGEGAAGMFTALAIGMLAGRFVAGIALDRFRAHLVGFITLGLPSMGLFIIASTYDAPAILALAVFCLGFAFGAEGDIVAFLVARHFGVEIYSSVMGLLTCAIGISTALGAALLSVTMAATGGYDAFLLIVGGAVLAGSLLLLLLRQKPEAVA